MSTDEVLDSSFTPGPSAADLDQRLTEAFEATFPDLPREAIRTASIDTVSGWDSLQSLTLMALLEDEFGIEISPFDLAELDSFDHIRAFVLRAQ